MSLIIDCHGHQTLVPQAHLEFREAQKARLKDPSLPRPNLPDYADEELQEIIANNQFRLQQERGADIGCNLNPDPSGGHFSAPSLTDRYWYPLYEKMVELRVPAMIHVSGSCNECLHATGSYYMAADTNAFMNLMTGDLFSDFPELNFIIPHGGGAVPYHWGRYRGLADMMKRPSLDEYVMGNVYFDTCVYHQPGIDLLFDVIDPKNILFASEMIGAVRGIDPQTGHYFDDTKRYVENLGLAPEVRHNIFEGNARRVYPRLDELLQEQGR